MDACLSEIWVGWNGLMYLEAYLAAQEPCLDL